MKKAAGTRIRIANNSWIRICIGKNSWIRIDINSYPVDPDPLAVCITAAAGLGIEHLPKVVVEAYQVTALS